MIQVNFNFPEVKTGYPLRRNFFILQLSSLLYMPFKFIKVRAMFMFTHAN